MARRIRSGLAKRAFDQGNGEKILKRWIGLAGLLDARISKDDLFRILVLRPALRESIYTYIRSADLTPARAYVLARAAESGHLVDDAGLVDLVNYLVETTVTTTYRLHTEIMRVAAIFDVNYYYGAYSLLWLLSKYGDVSELLGAIVKTNGIWASDERLGRIVGAFTPIFRNTPEEDIYKSLLSESRNDGVRDAYRFHIQLSSHAGTFGKMYDALKSPNPSRGTGITHAKFLCLMSALTNNSVAASRRLVLRTNNAAVWRDVYYRRVARRLGV